MSHKSLTLVQKTYPMFVVNWFDTAQFVKRLTYIFLNILVLGGRGERLVLWVNCFQTKHTINCSFNTNNRSELNLVKELLILMSLLQFIKVILLDWCLRQFR